MKEYKILISLNAECEEDMKEVIEELYEEQHPCEIEWWCEVGK